MIIHRLIIFIAILIAVSFFPVKIVNSAVCTQPDFRVYCGYCDGRPTVKETAACIQECSETKWKMANEEFDQCIKSGGTPGLSDDMQKEIQKVLPDFRLPMVPDIKLHTTSYTPQKELVVKNLTYGKDIKEGDLITGEKGVKTVIHMPDGSVIDVREGGQIIFKSENLFEAPKGFFKFLFSKITQKSRTFTVRTKVAIAGVRGTEFLVESDESKTIFTALQGTIEVSDLDAKKTVEVSEGNTVVVEKGKLPSDPKPFNPNSIDRWYETPSQISYLFVILPIVLVIFIIFFLRNRSKKLS